MLNKTLFRVLTGAAVVVVSFTFFSHDHSQKRLIKAKDVKISNLETSFHSIENAYEKIAEKHYRDSIIYNSRIDTLIKKSEADDAENRQLIARIKSYVKIINEKDESIVTLTGRIADAGKRIDSITEFSNNAGEALKETRSTIRDLNSQLDLVRRHACESLSFIMTAFWTTDFTEAYTSIKKWCKPVPEEVVNSVYLDKSFDEFRRIANDLRCPIYESLYAFCIARGINPATVSKNEIRNTLRNFFNSEFKFWGNFFGIDDKQLERIRKLSTERFGL
jgi:hypothetical protein